MHEGWVWKNGCEGYKGRKVVMGMGQVGYRICAWS